MGNAHNAAGAVPNGIRPMPGVIQPSMEPNGSPDRPSQPTGFVAAGLGGFLGGPFFDATPAAVAKTGKQLALEGCQKAYQELIGTATKVYQAELERVAKLNLSVTANPSADALNKAALAAYNLSCDAADLAYAANEVRYKDK